MDTDAAFEELFTDEYWQATAVCWRELAEMLHTELGEGSGLARHFIDHPPTKPGYLTALDRKTLRTWYEETLEEAERMAASLGTCPACGSANLAATVVPAPAKFKPNVDCADCSTLLAYG
jgi:hypothetical protein